MTAEASGSTRVNKPSCGQKQRAQVKWRDARRWRPRVTDPSATLPFYPRSAATYATPSVGGCCRLRGVSVVFLFRPWHWSISHSFLGHCFVLVNFSPFLRSLSRIVLYVNGLPVSYRWNHWDKNWLGPWLHFQYQFIIFSRSLLFTTFLGPIIRHSGNTLFVELKTVSMPIRSIKLFSTLLRQPDQYLPSTDNLLCFRV